MKAAVLAFLLLAPARAERFWLEAEPELDGGSPYQLSVTLRLRPGEPEDFLDFSNGDLRFLEPVRRWQLQIFDFDQRKVSYRQGLGAPSTDKIRWTALTPEGRLLRDGFYRAVFAWLEEDGTPRRTEGVEVAVLSPPGLRRLADADVALALDGDELVLRLSEDLTFEAGQWRVKRQAMPTLGKIVEFLQEYPDNKLVVLGHADATGGDPANLELSRRRARVVRDILVSSGIAPERLTYEGVGSSQPIASNATEEGRQRNRRVDIVVKKPA